MVVSLVPSVLSRFSVSVPPVPSVPFPCFVLFVVSPDPFLQPVRCFVSAKSVTKSSPEFPWTFSALSVRVFGLIRVLCFVVSVVCVCSRILRVVFSYLFIVMFGYSLSWPICPLILFAMSFSEWNSRNPGSFPSSSSKCCRTQMFHVRHPHVLGVGQTTLNCLLRVCRVLLVVCKLCFSCVFHFGVIVRVACLSRSCLSLSLSESCLFTFCLSFFVVCPFVPCVALCFLRCAMSVSAFVCATNPVFCFVSVFRIRPRFRFRFRLCLRLFVFCRSFSAVQTSTKNIEHAVWTQPNGFRCWW